MAALTPACPLVYLATYRMPASNQRLPTSYQRLTCLNSTRSRYHRFMARDRVHNMERGLTLTAGLLFIFGTIDVYKVLDKHSTDDLPYVMGQMLGSLACVAVSSN